MSENSLVEAYVRDANSPSGKWWVEVPVGLSVQSGSSKSLAPKHIDAVCLTTRSQQLPESYADSQAEEYVNPSVAEPGATRAELFRRLSNSEYFTDETATIVEAKTGSSSFKAIGQLQAYKELLEQDYGWTVEEQILLSAQRDPIIDQAARSLDIRVVAVR
jgi:hypothetical protein